MQQISRRTVLIAASATGVAAMAGCVDELVGGGGPEFAQYVPADAGESEALYLIHVDFEQAEEELPEEVRNEFSRETILQGTPLSDAGIEAADIEGLVMVGSGFTNVNYVMYGSFDTGAIDDVMVEQNASEPEDYGGYSVYESSFAVGEEIIILSQDYESYVDVAQGDADQLGAGDGEWSGFLGRLSSGPMTVIGGGDNTDSEGVVRYAIVVQGGDSDMMEVTIDVEFDSEGAANNATDGDAIDSQLESDLAVGGLTVNSVEVDGVYVTIEGEAPASEL